MLGLSRVRSEAIPDAIPLLEETRLGERQLELATSLVGLHPDAPAKRARATLARTFGLAPSRPRRGRCRAAHAVDGNGAASRGRAEAGRREGSKIPRAHYLLGQLALFRGKLDEAIALSEKELTINPSDAMAFHQLGDAYLRASKLDEAIAALQKSLWLNPLYSALCTYSWAPLYDRPAGNCRRHAAAGHPAIPTIDRRDYFSANSCSGSAAPTKPKEFAIAESRCSRQDDDGNCAVHGCASACACAVAMGAAQPVNAPASSISFTDVAREAGLVHPSIYGGLARKRWASSKPTAWGGCAHRRRP